MTLEEAKEFVQNDVYVIDIRDDESFNLGHIKGAIALNQDVKVQEFLQSAVKSKPLLCCCYHGLSSQSAKEFFQAQGFQEVHSLEGGFEQWKSLGYPMEV